MSCWRSIGQATWQVARSAWHILLKVLASVGDGVIKTVRCPHWQRRPSRTDSDVSLPNPVNRRQSVIQPGRQVNAKHTIMEDSIAAVQLGTIRWKDVFAGGRASAAGGETSIRQRRH